MAQVANTRVSLATLPQELIDLTLSFLATSERDLQALRATNRSLSHSSTYPLADVYETRLSTSRFLTNRYALVTLLGLVRVRTYRARMQHVDFLFATGFLKELSRQFGASDVITEKVKEQSDFWTVGKGDAYDILTEIVRGLKESGCFQRTRIGVLLGPNILAPQYLPCFGMSRLACTVLPYFKRREFQAMKTASRIPMGATMGTELDLMMKILKDAGCLDKLALDIHVSTNFAPKHLNTEADVGVILRSHRTERIGEIKLRDGYHRRTSSTNAAMLARPPYGIFDAAHQLQTDNLWIDGYEHSVGLVGERKCCLACNTAAPLLESMPLRFLQSLCMRRMRLEDTNTLCNFLDRQRSTLKVLHLSHITLLEQHWRPVLQFASSLPVLTRFHGASLRQLTCSNFPTIVRPYVEDHVECEGVDEVKRCLQETVEHFTLAVESSSSFFVVFSGGVVNSFS